MRRVEVNVQTGEILEIELSAEEVAALQAQTEVAEPVMPEEDKGAA